MYYCQADFSVIVSCNIFTTISSGSVTKRHKHWIIVLHIRFQSGNVSSKKILSQLCPIKKKEKYTKLCKTESCPLLGSGVCCCVLFTRVHTWGWVWDSGAALMRIWSSADNWSMRSPNGARVKIAEWWPFTVSLSIVCTNTAQANNWKSPFWFNKQN